MAHTIELKTGSRETSTGDYRVFSVSPEIVVYARIHPEGWTGGYVHSTWRETMPGDVKRLATDIMEECGYSPLKAAISGYHDGQYTRPSVWGWRHSTGKCWIWLEWNHNSTTDGDVVSGTFDDLVAAEKFCESRGVRFGGRGIY